MRLFVFYENLELISVWASFDRFALKSNSEQLMPTRWELSGLIAEFQSAPRPCDRGDGTNNLMSCGQLVFQSVPRPAGGVSGHNAVSSRSPSTRQEKISRV